MNYENRILKHINLYAIALSMALWSMQVVAQEEAPTSAAEQDANAAIAKLAETNKVAKELLATCKGVLVFPNIVKGGFIIAAKYGTGMLLEGNTEKGFYGSEHYNIAAASYGLQAGVRSFAYAMVLMDDATMRYIETRSGFELGMGPSLTVVDAGFVKGFTTGSIKSGIYAFTFGAKGLMGGLGLEGTKITKLNK
jgi:lipid-binding SYLF domain-containing protein